jgi:hypothetical protein
MDRIRAVMAEPDPQREIPRIEEMWYFGEREGVGDWLRRLGWKVTVTPPGLCSWLRGGLDGRIYIHDSGKPVSLRSVRWYPDVYTDRVGHFAQ